MIDFDNTANESAEYAAFVDKFKPKKTSDDCYTPPNVYDAVLAWAVREYGLEGRKILRPFYPGGDYVNADYPDGCVVIDNPPFSILSKICAFYDGKGIDYFLFAPALTLFSTNSGRSNYVVTANIITYANGAKVHTGFITNMGDCRVVLAPDLAAAVETANRENTAPAVELPKYDYPHSVVTAATLARIVKRGVPLRIPSTDVYFVRALDQQRESKKAIFGSGFILSEKAAAEKAAAEKAAAEKLNVTLWGLSPRERAIAQSLGGE